MPKRRDKEIRNRILLSTAVALLATASAAFGGTYWVSPTGSTAWVNCQSATDPGSNYCSLATANSNAAAGDIVNLKSGTYNTQIAPANSGSSGNVVTYQGESTDQVIITDTGTSGSGIFLDGKDYIKIAGITVTNVSRWANIRNGADYNEITNCKFTDDDGVVTGKGIHIWGQCSGGSPYTCPATNNWVHHNSFSRNGWVGAVDCQDEGGVFNVGSITAGDGSSNNNTIENNILFSGGHHLLEINTKKNVIRNNVFHNEGWMDDPGTCTWGPSPRNGKYGNRNIQLYDAHNAGPMYNLIEHNRVGHAAFASDGGMDGDIVIASQSNVVRHNFSYYSETMGIYFKQGSSSSSSNNRVYNNTVFASGQDSMIYPNSWTGYGDKDWRLGIYFVNAASIGNVVKNNLVYNSNTEDIRCGGVVWPNCQVDNLLTNNWVTADGDPQFVNPDVSDPTSTTLPDLSLRSGSGAIDKGTYLTQANGSGGNSTTLVVDDALYFQDGSFGSAISNIQADWIAIGTVNNVVQIRSIDYSTNTITLASAVTWSDNANIWLYQKSDGTRVLRGSAPDIGAHEYGSGDTLAPAAPTNLSVQ